MKAPAMDYVFLIHLYIYLNHVHLSYKKLQGADELSDSLRQLIWWEVDHLS